MRFTRWRQMSAANIGLNRFHSTAQSRGGCRRDVVRDPTAGGSPDRRFAVTLPFAESLRSCIFIIFSLRLRSGTVTKPSNGRGLRHSADAGQTFRRATDTNTRVELFGLGRAAPGSPYPALRAAAAIAGLRAVWRSDDGGAKWVRINDDEHEWGRRFRAVSGDPRRDSGGLIYGDPAAGQDGEEER